MQPRLRILSFLLIVVVLLGSGLARVGAAGPADTPNAADIWLAPQDASPPNITAEFGAVIDGDSGQVLYAKNIHGRTAPASLTKIVTAIVALEKGKLSDTVKVNVDSKKMEVETNSSVMGLMPGEELSLEALLYGLLLPSGNDAAVAIAQHIGGSESRFVQMMNDKVKELGFTNTHFANPHGLDASDHYSTAYEMAMLGRYAMKNTTFAKIVATKEITVAGRQKKYFLENSNALLWDSPDVDGVKIGYTGRARQAIVASAKRNGKRLFVTLIRSTARVSDSRALLNFFFAPPETGNARPLVPAPAPTSTPPNTPTRVPTATPLPTNTAKPTFTRTFTPSPTSTPTLSPTPSLTPAPTPEKIDVKATANQESWFDALLGLPGRVIASAFSFIGSILPH